LQTVRHRFNIYAGSRRVALALSRRWAPQTRYTLRRNTAEYNERFGFGNIFSCFMHGVTTFNYLWMSVRQNSRLFYHIFDVFGTRVSFSTKSFRNGALYKCGRRGFAAKRWFNQSLWKELAYTQNNQIRWNGLKCPQTLTFIPTKFVNIYNLRKLIGNHVLSKRTFVGLQMLYVSCKN